MNLADWLKGDHEPSERLSAAVSLCRAVSEDSGRGLDLDPAHIQMTGDGECRPTEGKVVPSGRYRAPEVAQGQPPVPQSQVFTVGVLCFEILSGRDFESRGGPLLRDLRPDLPRDVSDAVQACLEMDAEWRPKDVSYLLGLVEGLAASGGSGGKAAARGGRPARRLRRAGQPRSAGRPRPAAVAAPRLRAGRARGERRDRGVPPASAHRAAGLAAARRRRRRCHRRVTGRGRDPGAVAFDAGRRARRSRRPAASVPARRWRATPVVVARAFAAPPLAPPVAVAAAPSAAPADARARLRTAARAAEPATPAAVTNVSPPVLHRGANVLVDVHGVGLRSDHQVRIARPREAARGVEVMRQRYVGPALLQVLLRIDARRVRPAATSCRWWTGRATRPTRARSRWPK